MADIQVEGAAHGSHIQKGAIFEVGKAAALKDLGKEDKLLAAQLIVSDAVGDANDPALVKRIQDEVAAERKAEAAHEKRIKAFDAEVTGSQLLAALAQAAGVRV